MIGLVKLKYVYFVYKYRMAKALVLPNISLHKLVTVTLDHTNQCASDKSTSLKDSD